MINICLNDGMVDSNVYIAGDNGEGVVVDCGIRADEIYEAAVAAGLKIKYIILTHCHFDHVFYTDDLKKLTGAKVIIHKNDAPDIDNKFFAEILGFTLNISAPDMLVEDGDSVTAGGHKFTFIHTPGHSAGSMCILVDDILYSGDTLFKLSMGRTDFRGGNEKDIHYSLARLCKLPEDTKVFPGHGEETTIGYEQDHNPYVKMGGVN